MSDILSAERLSAEVEKLLAEKRKLLAEEYKLMTEGKKLERERYLYPLVVFVSATGAVAALFGAAIAVVKYFLF